ncbi:hypothetical protein AZE42_14130 [Rhizopogon vesiculosus]|uniref:Uncharacterized protein n=1 Tax=Rhizopogon vesiculosus TaxID=180088 RepID=A0A1J8QV16_9AGAM|nr:hypothetical protein AZE42_14130 [Rhizopogon vesiculosus]
MPRAPTRLSISLRLCNSPDFAVVSAFYDNMIDGSGRLDCRRAAVSLHEAVKKLRKEIPFEQQIVFVHIGI